MLSSHRFHKSCHSVKLKLIIVGKQFSKSPSCFFTSRKQGQCLGYRLAFQECLYSSWPQEMDRSRLPPKQRAGRLTVHYKRCGFPKLRFPLLSCNPQLAPEEIRGWHKKYSTEQGSVSISNHYYLPFFPQDSKILNSSQHVLSLYFTD